jgi:hypothetical protein
MRPFVLRFSFLLGLLLVLTGVALNLEAKTTLAVSLVWIGLAIAVISMYLQKYKKKTEEIETFPEPNPEDFEDKDDVSYTIEEKDKKKN